MTTQCIDSLTVFPN